MQQTARLLQPDYSSLDQPEFSSQYAFGETKENICFYIDGIRCAKCVRKIESLALTVPGLQSLTVEMGKNLATARIDSKILNFSRLAERIAEQGFTPVPVANAEDALSAEKKSDREELVRLAVAGACAGNIMTFSFAVYFGAAEKFFSLFAWISFFLYLPVLTYVALPFYKGTLQSLRRKELSIDLPMTVASVAGFIFSSVQLWRGHQDIYFDSISGFLFLILASRYVQRRLQRRYLRQEDLVENFKMARVRKEKAGTWVWSLLQSLTVGNRIRLQSGETLPCDGILESEKAFFGLAWLTGESKPKVYLKNATVPAGAKLQSESATLVVKNTIDETGFGKILKEIKILTLNKTKTISLSDRWAQYLLVTVFSVAAIFLCSFWFISPEESIRRSLALIVLACPCAMAFGTPLAFASALKKARKKGLIVRNAEVLENVQSIKTIFLDKTGTLTETELTLMQLPNWIPEVYQKIILSLENISAHPMAFAFRKAFPTPENLLSIEQHREVPGRGVSGYIFGRFYEIKASVDLGEELTTCSLFEDGKVLFNFTFESKLLPECRSTLQRLRQQGFKLVLLSGDRKEAVESLGKILGFGHDEIFFEKSPEEKAEIVASEPDSMMVGDGVNDSLSMLRSRVAIAASGGVEASLNSSDVYLVHPSLSGIVDLIEISRSCARSIRRNLRVSLFYNTVGGFAALLGLINPLVAAILMPISSGLILFSTWLGERR